MSGSSQPKYMDIVDWTLEQVTTGAVSPGDKFYSENVLRERFKVSRQTVRRAFEALEQLGYITRIKGSGTFIEIPPELPLTVPKGHVHYKSVGIITTYVDAYIFPAIIQGVETVLSNAGFTVQLTSTKNSVEGELRALQMMSENNLDGLIVWPTKSGLPAINQSYYHAFIEKGLPIVFVDSYYPDIPGICVSIDDEQVGYLATEHLIEMGHKEILGIFPHSDRQGYLRYKGYIKALYNHGIVIRDENIHWYTKDDIEGELNNPMMMTSVRSGTAAFCFNDSVALQFIDILHHHNLLVPDDFSVVGVDNTLMGRRGKLTSIVHPGDKLGQTAAQLLLDMLHGQKGHNVLFPPQLIKRESVKQLEVYDALTE